MCCCRGDLVGVAVVLGDLPATSVTEAGDLVMTLCPGLDGDDVRGGLRMSSIC